MQAARLSLDGSNLPIVARIERSSEHALVVGRSLPFLKLGTRVCDQDGRYGAISSVSMNIADGVPHLSVELDYDREEEATQSAPIARARRDETLGYEIRSSRSSVLPPAPRRDDTNHDRTLDLALAVTPAFPQEPPVFVPSLYPMPLPIPAAPSVPRHRPWARRALTFLATLGAFLFAWARPSAFGG